MVNVFTEFIKPLFRGQAQECFENARREWQLRKKRGEDPVYWIGRVYGYSIEDDPEKKLPAPVHHAWVTVGDKIADPSPFRYGKGKWSRLPDMPAEDFWLPGTEYRGDYIVDDERLDEPIYYMPTKEEMKREKRSSDGSPLVARARRAALELEAYLAHDDYRSREDLDEYQVGVAGDITAAEWGESFNVSKGDPGDWGKPMWEEYPWVESWSTVGPATGGWLILGDSKRAYTQVQAELELCCKSEAALEIVAEAEERVEHLKAIESVLKIQGAEIADTLAPCDCEVCQERDSSWPDPTPEMLDDPDFNAVWEAIKTWDISVPEVYGNLYSGATGNHVRRILDALKEVDKLNASEALYAFGAWLTTRDESITMSGHDDAAPVAEVIGLFCEENNLSDPRPGWEKNISFPEQIGKRIGMIAGIVAIEKFEMLPLPPDKLLKAREAVARLADRHRKSILKNQGGIMDKDLTKELKDRAEKVMAVLNEYRSRHGRDLGRGDYYEFDIKFHGIRIDIPEWVREYLDDQEVDEIYMEELGTQIEMFVEWMAEEYDWVDPKGSGTVGRSGGWLVLKDKTFSLSNIEEVLNEQHYLEDAEEFIRIAEPIAQDLPGIEQKVDSSKRGVAEELSSEEFWERRLEGVVEGLEHRKTRTEERIKKIRERKPR